MRSELETKQRQLSLLADEILRKAKRPRPKTVKAKRRYRSAPEPIHVDDAHGIHVFADGACEPNPGPGAWAFVVIVDGQIAHQASGAESHTTNNRMEMAAVLAALEWIADSASADLISVYTDSAYVVNGCNDWRHGWRAKGWMRKGGAVLNADLWQSLDAALSDRPQRLTWVKGHAGIRGNELADRLACQALTSLERSSQEAA